MFVSLFCHSDCCDQTLRFFMQALNPSLHATHICKILQAFRRFGFFEVKSWTNPLPNKDGKKHWLGSLGMLWVTPDTPKGKKKHRRTTVYKRFRDNYCVILRLINKVSKVALWNCCFLGLWKRGLLLPPPGCSEKFPSKGA